MREVTVIPVCVTEGQKMEIGHIDTWRPPAYSSNLQTGGACFNHLLWSDYNVIQRTNCAHRIYSYTGSCETDNVFQGNTKKDNDKHMLYSRNAML